MERLSLFEDDQRYKITKPIRLIELFAGVGSQAMALRNLGVEFEHYKICEWAIPSIIAYDLVHTNDGKDYSSHMSKEELKNYLYKRGISNNYNDPMTETQVKRLPKEKLRRIYNAIHRTNNLVNIMETKGEDLEIVETDKYEYIMTYSFPCFVGDSLVLTSKGYKQIKDIQKGDRVLTHTNTYKEVNKVFNQGEKEIWSIRGMAIDEIKTTSNHKFYVREKYREGGRRLFKEPVWKEVKDLTKDHYLGVAINSDEIIPNWDGITFEWADGRKDRHKNELGSLMSSIDFWWIIGRYMGDGWARKQGGIIICCAKEETSEITSRLNGMFNYNIAEERTTNKIHIPIKELGLFVEQFGSGASNKHLTNTIINLPINLLKSFLEGYLSADGCYIEKLKIHKACSVSKELIYGIAQCVAKVYKTPYRVYKTKRSKTTIIEGREVNQKNDYQLCFKLNKGKQDKAFYEDGYIWYPIQEIKNTLQKETVYDIEVEEDHSFTVQNTIAHNCQDLSLAGKQAGMGRDSGTRSGMLWEVERLLKETKELPQILLMENVPQVIGKNNRHDFHEWGQFLAELGYSNYIENLNAKDYGVPQNRNRTFMVSILGEGHYEFPKPIGLNLKLKDMLESNVGEKYYLSKKTIDRISNWKAYQDPLKDIENEKVICPTLTARGAGEEHSGMVLINENSFKNNEIVDHTSSKNFWRSYEGKDIVPTLKTNNHLGVVEKPEKNLKEQLVDKLIAQDLVRENDVIKHSYSTSRMKDDNRPRIEMNNISPTLDTRCDCLGVVVKEECITLPENTKSGYVEAYEGDGVYINRPHQKRGVVQDQMIQTLKTNVDDLGVVVKNESLFTDSNKQMITEDGNVKRYINSDIVDEFGIGDCADLSFPNGYGKGTRVSKETSQTLTASSSTSLAVKEPSLRIRKLTPKECWRLMGFLDSDFDKVESELSNSQLYHIAGDSICTNVLMAIFGQFFDVDWKEKWGRF